MAKWKFRPTKEMQSMISGEVQKGKKFELVVQFEQEGSDWCITEIEGIPAPGYKDDDDDKDNRYNRKPDAGGGEFGKRYMAAMNGPMAPNQDEGSG